MTPTVLFLCVHNAGRSQMAAGWMRHLAGETVITMGCGDTCPYVPGTRYVDWELTDPHGQGIETVRPIRDEIEMRVRDLLAELAPSETR